VRCPLLLAIDTDNK